MKTFSSNHPARVCFLNGNPLMLVMEIWYGMVSELRNTPWIRMIMLDLNERDVQKAVDWGADLLVAHVGSETANAWLLATGLPVINTSGIQDPAPFPTVTLDNHRTGEEAAKHLLEKGYTRFGFVGETRPRYARERLEGFTATIQTAGFAPPRVWQEKLESFEFKDPSEHLGIAHRLYDWAAGEGQGMGLLVLDDFLGQTVMDHLSLATPDFLQEIGLVSTHHFRVPTFPTLSGVKQSEERWGRAVGRLAIDILQGKPDIPALTQVSPMGVLGRETTSTRHTHDHRVRQALRLIHRDVAQGINVQDVVDKMEGIQRRALERRFVEATGHSILEEIQQTRIQRACLLLSDTEQSLEEVARNAGFRDTRHLHRVFTAKMDTDPAEYRQRNLGVSGTPT
ncbi:MAG: helix-turn-helix domain-containing protein [Verrucomicrobia bacterium]|nr:helix-turn-helix domain-containing protein [Verrucomicrobiota bacterium]MCH8511983.1 helix-turn-helix domain-containing protein [Kiritimatiellia bacterium]